MSERYEVVKTLIRGKQSVRKTETKSGITISAHKKPVGYALMDTKNNELNIVTYLEALEMVTKSGSINGQITVTERSNGRRIPYIRAKAGVENFQSENMVEDPVVFVDANPNAKVSNKMKDIIEKYRTRSQEPSKEASEKSKYTKQDILGMIEELKTTP